jgi:hypothetical protein
MLGAQQHLDAGYVAAIKAHNPQATKAKRAARRATANTFLRALALRVLSPQQTHGCSPKELLDRGFAIQLAGGAKKCAGLAYQVILGRAHRVRRWGGQGGANYDDFRRAVEKLKTDFNITEEQAVARLQAVEGKLRHPYLVGLDGKVWGGQGGANYDDFRRTVEKLKTDFNITEEQAVARLQAVEGKLRHPYLVGLDATAKGGRRGGQGGANYDDFRRAVEKLKTDFNITEEQAVARLQAVEGKLRHPYLVGLDGKVWGGQGGANYDDFRRTVEKLKTDFNITEEQAVARLQAVEGKLRHPYLVGLDRQRANIVAYNESGQKKENRADSGNAGNHAAVQTRVRKSSASLVEFELDSIFSPLKDTDKDSLTYIMPETQVQKARKAAREAHALEKSSETLNDFKLRTWTVSCLLSDLWYVNRDSIAKRTLRAGGRVQDGT